MSELKCVVVTPERTELEQTAESIIIPMFDGEFGILKGHSPVIGRLGYGALKLRRNGAEEKYFVDGGFVQVANNVVSILTDHFVPVAKLDAAAAQKSLEDAGKISMKTPEGRVEREKAVSRARAQVKLASK